MTIAPTPVMTSVVMPGGWHYKERGKMLVEDAINYEDLINMLAGYRATNRLPLGNPQKDIDNYICRNFPNMCGRGPTDPNIEDKVELCYGQPVIKTPRERVMQWAANRMQKAGQLNRVDMDEATRRGAICAACPLKVRWNEPVEGCPGCQVYVEEAESMLVKIRANKSAGNQLSGLACTVAGHDLETACWLEEAGLRHRRNYEGQLPQHCWMHDLL